MGTISKAWGLLSPRERRMAWAVLALVIVSSMLAVAMVGAIYPFFAVVSDSEGILHDPRYAPIWERLGITTPERLIVVAGAATLTAILVANVVALVKAYAMARYFAMRTFALSARVFRLQARQPYEDFLATHPSVFIQRTITEPDQIVGGFMEPLGNMIAALVSIVLMLALLVFLNPMATLVVFGLFTCFYFAIMTLTRGPLRRKGAHRLSAATGRTKVLHELARCAREVRMSGQEDAFVDRFERHTGTVFHSHSAMQFWSQIPRYVMQVLFFGGVVLAGMLIVLVGDDPAQARQTLTDALPLTGVFVMAAQRMIPELQSVYASFGRLAYGAAAVDAMWADIRRMEASALPDEAADPLDFERLDMRGVGLAYAGQAGPAIHGVDLTIRKGEKIAITGPSGSGKSSLLQVLMGLLVPQEGTVEVNGRPMTPALASAWRATVVQVPQEVVVLSDTLLRNVALGEPDEIIDRARAAQALRDVQLDGWVEGLKDGLDTDMDAGAAPLSGGQKQRLGIARALYRDADVVILDEATSALDAATQDAVLDIMARVFADKTVVSIAHRPEALVGFPRRIVLEAGCLVRDQTFG